MTNLLHTSSYEIQQEVEEARMKQEEATAALLAASSTPQHHHVAEQEDTEENDDIPNGDISKDLYIGDEPIEDPVEERRTLAERNERLQNQLKVWWKQYELGVIIYQVAQFKSSVNVPYIYFDFRGERSYVLVTDKNGKHRLLLII